jgi:DNA-binding PucR family transcriptional regulator
LLADPELSEHMNSFANDLLEPLVAYDFEKNARLTETLALTLTMGSAEEVANRLYVHPKTVRYRIRRAEEILGKKLDSPIDRTALRMAAFVWISRQRTQR